MKGLTPIILIAVSIGIFFFFIDPQYKEAKSLNEEIGENDKTIALATELRNEREKLQARFNAIGSEEKDMMQKILPDTVDNVRLVLDINNIANDVGIEIDDINVEGNSTVSNTDDTRVINESIGGEYGTIGLSFSVTASYESFKEFMIRLEDSLRLVDVVKYSVGLTGQPGILQYSVIIDTYWLR